MSVTSPAGPSQATVEAIKQKARLLSIYSMMSTTAAGAPRSRLCGSVERRKVEPAQLADGPTVAGENEPDPRMHAPAQHLRGALRRRLDDAIRGPARIRLGAPLERRAQP